MQILKIELNKLKPNDYNPNEMPAQKLEQLKKTIKKNGYTQPIVVKKNEDDSFTIVDGEHRWLAMKDEPEFKTPQEVVVIEVDDDLAKIQTINHNHLRGSMDSVKMAGIVKDLSQRWTMEELEKVFGMNAIEIEDLNTLLDYSVEELPEEDLEALNAIAQNTDPIPTRTVDVIFYNGHEIMLEEAKGLLPPGTSPEDDGACLIKILRMFLRQNDINPDELIKSVEQKITNPVEHIQSPAESPVDDIEEEIGEVLGEEPVEPAL